MKQIKNAMITSFKEKCHAFGNIESHVVKLKDELKKVMSESVTQLVVQSKKDMIEYLNTIYLTALSIKEYKSAGELMADIRKMRSQLMEKCKLSCKYEIWDQYMNEKIIGLLEQFSMRDDKRKDQYMLIKDKEILNLQEIIVND